MRKSQPSVSGSSDQYRWRKRDAAVVPSTFLGRPFSNEPVKKPYEYFKQFFDKELISLITEQTNLYYTQQKLSNAVTSNFTPTTEEEIEQYLGILLLTGVFPYPQYRMYWSKTTPFPKIANALQGGVNRFDQVKRFLHFNDNSKMDSADSPQKDKLFKLRPLIDALQNKCRSLEQEEFNSIDEQMIPSKFRSPLKQYMPNKPHKWGYKVFSRCGASGIVYDFEVYTGKSTENPGNLGVTGDLIVRLCTHLPKNQNYKVFFDNFFYIFIVVEVSQARRSPSIGHYQKQQNVWGSEVSGIR